MYSVLYWVIWSTRCTAACGQLRWSNTEYVLPVHQIGGQASLCEGVQMCRCDSHGEGARVANDGRQIGAEADVRPLGPRRHAEQSLFSGKISLPAPSLEILVSKALTIKRESHASLGRIQPTRCYCPSAFVLITGRWRGANTEDHHGHLGNASSLSNPRNDSGVARVRSTVVTLYLCRKSFAITLLRYYAVVM